MIDNRPGNGSPEPAVHPAALRTQRGLTATRERHVVQPALETRMRESLFLQRLALAAATTAEPDALLQLIIPLRVNLR